MSETQRKIQHMLQVWQSLYGKEAFVGKFEKQMEMQDKVVEFAKNIKDKYGNEECTHYAAFHILAGSTPRKSWSEFPEEYVDFPDGDSIEKFLEKLSEEYKEYRA